MKPFISLLIMLCIFNLQGQDWANLNRFKSDIDSIKASTFDASRIVFMGNSIIQSWQQFRPEFFENEQFINRGISGQTTSQMLLRFQQDVIDLKPSAVVILAGINDIAENTGPITIKDIFNNINAMTILAKANGIQVFLCSVLPANNFPWRQHLKPADKVIKLNQYLKTIAAKHQAIYVDYYSLMVDDKKGLKDDLGYDGVHPNKEGYSVMESILMTHINRIKANTITHKLPDPLEAGWNGKKVCKVLKEDKHQRILKCIFPPNVGHQKHYHQPHFGYTIKGGTFKIKDDSGTKTINVKDGTTWSKDEVSVHEVLNIGKTTSEYLIIEQKN